MGQQTGESIIFTGFPGFFKTFEMKKIQFTAAVLSPNLRDYVPIQLTGYLFTAAGHDFVAHRPTCLRNKKMSQSDSDWSVSHYATGAKLCGPFGTRAQAEKAAGDVLERRMKDFEEFVQTAKIINP